MMKRLSVVIPTYNRRHVLERTLPALSAQDLPPEEYEVIVVVDGSTDGSVELLRVWKPKCAFRILESENRGPSAARNAGIHAAVGDIVLLLDDDHIAVPALFRKHCESHSGSEPSLVHGPVRVAPSGSKTMFRYISETCYEGLYHRLNPEMELRYPEQGDSFLEVIASMGNSSIPRDTLLASGAFDERIRAAEDLELGVRLWKMGVPFRFQPAAIVYEFHVKSSGNYLQNQAPALGAGDLIASRKHPEYRSHSRLAGFAETSHPRRWLRSALVRLPVSPVPMLGLPLRFEKWFYSFSPMRQLGGHLLRFAETVARLRGALSVAGSWEALRSEFDRKLPGLLYHHVGPSPSGNPQALTVSPERFEQQMRWLARRGYTGITLSAWLCWRREGTGLPEKPIIITFDDAYADIAEFALPILRQYGFGAVVYVVTGQLGGSNNWDEAQYCRNLRLMTAEQIQYWAGQGIEFGAHTRTHPDLTRLSALDVSAEVVGSKNDLSALIGSPVISFAYPYGAYNDAIRELVQREFDLAFGVDEGMNYLRSDPHHLRRVHIGPTASFLEFALCVRRGKIKKFRALRNRLAVRTRLRRALSYITGRLVHNE
jgi:glycosyltransferase involved in cell wall biosynthesis/peptidoglycan/xylan/chitin deacetylase (PgdA/CDA1 family)